MQKFDCFLDSLAFEIRYSFGHLYWDRCGQTILDIETQCNGWFSARDKTNVGRLENPEKGITLLFSEGFFNFSINKPKPADMDAVKSDLSKIWKIVRANLGLDEYDRLASRFYYLKPTKSIEESEKLIEKSKFNIVVPGNLNEAGYDLNIRQLIAIFGKEDMEYRAELKGITRSEGVNPSSLMEKRPSAMSKRQNEYRLAKMKQIADYSTNPMCAVMLDIDCVKVNPEAISTTDFINEQLYIAEKDFLPILEEL